MFKHFLRQRQRGKLTDPHYSFLFEEIPDEWVSFDCETTGLDVADAELLSIGAVKIRRNEILTSESLYLLIKPENPMKAANISIHGLRPRDLSDGISAEEAVKQLLEFIGGRGLVGYYLEFDVAMVNKIIKPLLGIKLPNRQTEVSALFDQWQRKQTAYESYVDLSMANLVKTLQMPALPRHNALNDAVNAAMMFLMLRQRLNIK